ncbi:MAG: SDR family oxidoreductase [Betaproteobacteria bacterium]|nr:SDR family oxidoreductase [Betaproteobacteria bacterium]
MIDNRQYSLHNKVALIIGGTTGIGLASAKAFVACGARVVVAARNLGRGAEAELQLRAFGDAVFHPCDVNDPSSVAELVAFSVNRFGQLDCAVNSAAYDSKPATFHEMSNEDAGNTISTDVMGIFNCMKYQIEAMLHSGGGTIVNVSSVNGLSGVPGAAMYSAGKHAVIGLTRSAAKEYIGRGIRINAVCPGATETPRRERRTAHYSDDQLLAHKEQLAQAIPIGRLARAEEIASAILWLSSPESSYVVGHSLVVDGGLLA